MTALGPIAVARVSVTCVVCGLGRHPADARLGLDGLLTPQATRLVCLAGGRRSFASAEMLRTELCGWRVRDGRMRPACHAEAERIAAWRADPVRPTLPPSPHPLEFQVDATKVNTFTGGRDVTIGAFAPRWGAWAERLGLKSFDRLSVLGDGAEWKAADDQFPGHRGTLDFFPAGEHLAATAADGLFGAADAPRRGWSDAARGALLRDGWYGLQEHLGRTLGALVGDAGRAAVDELAGYLANHANRLNCRHRLATGEPISSGLIEGACKQVIGKRMKPTGARWTVPNANRMAESCCLTDSDQWAEYGNAAGHRQIPLTHPAPGV